MAFPLFAMPLFQLALNGLDLRQTADAASLSNICRNLGGSIGIALLSTITQTREQVHYQAISDRVSANAQAAAGRIDQLAAIFTARGDDAATAPMQAVATIAGQMHQEALVMAYSDAFMTLGVLLLLAMPSVFILPNIRPVRHEAPH
jgi:DHA2 family multidrug resistance protein